MKKNVASQSIGAEMITAADGTDFTGAVTVLITVDNGTQSASGGTAPAHEGNGYHSYTPTQAETNGDHIAFTFTGTGAITATVQVFTSFPQTEDNATNISTILVDTGTTIPATLGTPSADISADIAAVKVDTAATLVDTGTTIPATLGTPAADISADIAAVKVDTAATLVDTGTTIPATLGTPAADISADIAAVKVDTAATLVDTNELQADWVDGGRLDLILDARMAEASINTTGGAVDVVTAVTNQVTVADILTTAMTEAYAADGAAPTLAQAIFLIQQTIGDFAIVGTTITAKKLDGSTTAATYTLNDGTNPTSRTRAT